MSKQISPQPTASVQQSAADSHSGRVMTAVHWVQITRGVGLACLFCLGLGAVGWGLLGLVETAAVPMCMQPVDARTSQEQQQAARVGLAAGPAAVTVELAGAVVEPGLYQFSAQTRLGQAIDQAGGLSKKADRQQAAQQINLARVVEDGEKIYLPFKLESSFAKQLSQWCQQNGNPTSDFSNQQQNPADSPNSSSQACISLNQANSDQLQELNGIGPKRAEDIVAARPYQQVQDLVTKEVLSESIFSDIKNELCL